MRSNWTKEEYIAYYSVFEENNNCYQKIFKVESQLPSYTQLYYKGKGKSPIYDSLNAVSEDIGRDDPYLTDSILYYNSQFYQWSLIHLQ